MEYLSDMKEDPRKGRYRYLCDYANYQNGGCYATALHEAEEAEHVEESEELLHKVFSLNARLQEYLYETMAGREGGQLSCDLSILNRDIGVHLGLEEEGSDE